jgi:hypothetical protein
LKSAAKYYFQSPKEVFVKIFTLLLAAIFSAIFLLSFSPALTSGLAGRYMFWVGQGGLAVCLIFLLLNPYKKR